MSTKIILNADDFGGSATINEAVIRAHRQGVLTSASLMVAGDAVDEAIALAQETPTLAVGLHVVVAGGRAVLPPEQIPHIVDSTGCFMDDPLRAGLRYFFSRTAQQELARELEAQFERFAATGLSLSHVDSHLHMHLHPTVFDILLPLATRYGARGLRLPRDDFWFAMNHDRHHSGLKVTWAVTFGLLGRRCESRLGGNHLTVAHRVYGLHQTGHMHKAYVANLLRRLKVPTAELYFHPSTVFEGEASGPNPGDLETLLSPTIRQVIQEQDLCLATYSTLGKE
jgi:hopanoid biosynthesis associated protein HpnK